MLWRDPLLRSASRKTNGTPLALNSHAIPHSNNSGILGGRLRLGPSKESRLAILTKEIAPAALSSLVPPAVFSQTQGPQPHDLASSRRFWLRPATRRWLLLLQRAGQWPKLMPGAVCRHSRLTHFGSGSGWEFEVCCI